MSTPGYNKKMLKRCNQKENVQAYHYAIPKSIGLVNGGARVAMKQELNNQTYSSPKASEGSKADHYQTNNYQMSTSPYSPEMRNRQSSSSSPGSPSSFSHKAGSLANDLHCYFQCQETFKKDFDLRLHLKLRHKNEDPNELRKAEQAAEDEISFVKRSGSKFQCAICPKSFGSDSTMGGHAKKIHGIPWSEYKQKYGRCEVESAPFECKICGSVVKYTPNVVHSHIKQVHGLDWLEYLERIRKMARGEEPDPLPQIERFMCEICNSSVKFLRNHVSQVHNITEEEYETRITQMKRGLIPDALPSIEVFNCRICTSTVKDLPKHVSGVHGLTESDYEERMKKMNRGEDPGPLPNIEIIECRICNMSTKGFRAHLRRCHKVTLAEYEELFQE